MDRGERLDALDFNDDLRVDDEIHAVGLRNLGTHEVDRQLDLTFNAELAGLEGDFESVFVSRFEEPRAERFVDVDARRNDLGGQLIVTAQIHVHALAPQIASRCLNTENLSV